MPCAPILDRNRRRVGFVTFDPYVPPPSQRPRILNEGCEVSERRGFLDWYSFAEAMSKTHLQVKCRACGRYHIWKRKRRKRRRR